MRHSLSCAIVLTGLLQALGCQQHAGPSGAPTADNHAEHAGGTEDHGHDHGAGPHGGAIADWGGGKYHVEFTVNHDQQEATVFVLGDDAKTAVPVTTQELTLVINSPMFEVILAAAPQEGEAAGSSSRFVGKHEKLGIVQEFAGTITGEISGTPYSGDFREEP